MPAPARQQRGADRGRIAASVRSAKAGRRPDDAPAARTRISAFVTRFQHPDESFGVLDAQTAACLVGSAADIALVLDGAGTVCDLAVPSPELGARLGGPESWIGQTWASLLAVASRARAALLLADAAGGRGGKWLHLNHLAPDGVEVPILYAASPLRPKLGQTAKLVLFGRDLRPLSQLQQRLMDAQQTMERDHGRLRQIELRCRMLVHDSAEPLVVVNAATQKVIETNQAFGALAGSSAELLTGQSVLDLFAPADRASVGGLLTATRASAPHDSLPVALAGGVRIVAGASLFREDGAAFVLLRLRPEPASTDGHAARSAAAAAPAVLRLFEQAPDGYVVTDAAGRVLEANAAFAALVDANQADHLRGQSLDRWLGREGVDADILLNNLRQRGTVRLFATTLTGSSGITTAVEVSAVALAGSAAPPADAPAFGFALRDVERRVAEARPGRELPRSVDQLTELIGRVALKDLVREATDMIERLCIEAALEMTNDNRASAAELLGLSRQSLYVKLHRYGLGDLTDVTN